MWHTSLHRQSSHQGQDSKFAQEDLPTFMARFIQEAAAELEVLSMRASLELGEEDPAQRLMPRPAR